MATTPLLIFQIQKEIEESYTTTDWGKNERLLKDAARVAAFLASDTGKIDTLLEGLENEIEQVLKAKVDTAIQYYTTQAEYRKDKDRTGKSKFQPKKDEQFKQFKAVNRASYHKVVTQTIHTALTSVKGFSKDFPKFISFVQTTEFNLNLQAAKHWKDPGVAPVHGEFTHQLQWYLIVKSGLFNDLDLAKLFEAVGTITVSGTKIPGSGFNTSTYKGGLGLWEVLFDRGASPFPKVIDEKTDFRNPAILLQYIIGYPKRWSVLAAYLAARQAKREFEQAFAAKSPDKDLLKPYGIEGVEDVWAVQYLVRKKYPGKTLQQLVEEDKLLNEKDRKIPGLIELVRIAVMS